MLLVWQNKTVYKNLIYKVRKRRKGRERYPKNHLQLAVFYKAVTIKQVWKINKRSQIKVGRSTFGCFFSTVGIILCLAQI